jgi:peptidoglycan/xylan/chitin deacetylase (PgdA/CDA1 family)
MNMDSAWQPLLKKLARWSRAGRMARFWLRDDDAVEPSAALDRLLGLTGKFAVPATLAIIPAFTGEALASRLAEAPGVTVAVHGWSHRNYSPEGEKKQELGKHRPIDVVLNDLENGLSRIDHLHGRRAIPMLVPPWNRIDASLTPHLAGLGFTALSVFGPARPAAIPMINSNVDLMDWHGTRGCRDHAALIDEIIDQLDRGFHGGDPVGVLTHHLVHDEGAWVFLERLFEITARHEACRWQSASELIAA